MNRTVIDTLSFFLFAGDETTELDEVSDQPSASNGRKCFFLSYFDEEYLGGS